MHEQKPFQHVTEAELKLPTSALLTKLREAMTAPGSNGKTVEDEAKLIEWQAGAPEREVQVLEHSVKQYFDFLVKLLGKKSLRRYKFKDLMTGKENVLNIHRDLGDVRAIFTYGEKHIDLIFSKERDNSVFVKQHLGGSFGLRKLPQDATPYKNNIEFAGPNLKYLREELSALSGVIDAVDDFSVDLGW